MDSDSRPVSPKIYFNILQKFPVLLRLAIVFTALPLIILLPAVGIITSMAKTPQDKYDYNKISREGTQLKGRITDIKTNYTTRINNQHPSVISYTYTLNGKKVSSEIETLSAQKVAQIKAGDVVDIKAINNESEILSVEPFQFPYYLFYFLPLPFLVAGIILSIALTVRAMKVVALYKHGTIKDAKIISIIQNGTTGRNNVGKNMLIIDYYYNSISGTKMYGRSKDKRTPEISSLKQHDNIKIFVSEKDEAASCVALENML